MVLKLGLDLNLRGDVEGVEALETPGRRKEGGALGSRGGGIPDAETCGSVLGMEEDGGGEGGGRGVREVRCVLFIRASVVHIIRAV